MQLLPTMYNREKVQYFIQLDFKDNICDFCSNYKLVDLFFSYKNVMLCDRLFLLNYSFSYKTFLFNLTSTATLVNLCIKLMSNINVYVSYNRADWVLRDEVLIVKW